MLLIRLTELIYGYVMFTAQGGFPERFINLCSGRGIYIWNVKNKKGVIYACCEIKDYKKLRHIAGKTGMKMRIYKKAGLPFFLRHHRHRKAIPLSGILFVITAAILSRFIWTVDVTGNTNVPSEDIIAVFEEMGIKPGTLKSSVNAGETAKQCLLLLEDISWTALNIKGCSATIEVKEKTPKPEIREKSNIPTNIVASRSGVIEKFELYSGTACVKPGSPVREGDILVTGAYTNKNTSVTFSGADAYISAKTRREISVNTLNKIKARRYYKIKKRYSVSFFSLNFPISFLFPGKGNCEYFRDEKYLEVNNVKMPVGLITDYYSYYDEGVWERDEKTALLIAEQEYLRRYRETFSDKAVTDEKLKFHKSENGVEIFGEYECIEKIGEAKIMDIEAENSENKILTE